MGTSCVAQLTEHDSGRWLVSTQGSSHIWDLDRRTYLRLPGPGRGSFDHDGREVAFSRVEVWPQVGRCFMLWFDDPDAPQALEQWRRSSTVVSIERLLDEDQAAVFEVENPYGVCAHTKYEGAPPCVHSAWDEGFAAARAFYTNECFFCDPAGEYSTWACDACAQDPRNQWFIRR